MDGWTDCVVGGRRCNGSTGSCLVAKIDWDWLALAVIVALKAAATGYAQSSVEVECEQGGGRHLDSTESASVSLASCFFYSRIAPSRHHPGPKISCQRPVWSLKPLLAPGMASTGPDGWGEM